MATFGKTILSGSTDGRPINVAATSSPGTTIHTGSTTANDLHEIWLYAANYSSGVQWITVQWGNTSSSDLITQVVDPNVGLVLICAGLLIKGNATANIVRAYAGVTNTIAIHGYVNTIV
jgi:hypothetical protein